jgi:hypothetical protein
MKSLQACSAEATHPDWTETIKRLFRRYLKYRIERRARRRVSAENNILALYQGRSWCDATERELINDITNSHDSRL